MTFEHAARPASLRLARLHLRTGSLSLARAELEGAAGAGELDGDALLDLAEVRWRTADVIGAGEAADAYLEAGGDALVALVIAVEAAVARGGLGGSTDAGVLAERVLERARLPLDRIVAGMPLAGPWPPGMDVPPPPPEPTRDLGALVDPGPAGRQAAAPLVPVEAARAAVRATGGGPGPGDASAADPHAAYAAGTEALAAGDRDAAAYHLAVALRLSPALAPAILASVGGTPGPAYDLLRGDAFRLVGHESDARRAYASVARSLAERPDAAAAEAGDAVGEGPDAAGSTALPGDDAGDDDRVRPIAFVPAPTAAPPITTTSDDDPSPTPVEEPQ